MKKMQAHLKPRRTTTRVNNQQATFELKHRVVHAINKISDRDTYQIGVEELERTIKCLTPEAISPFLSCILDTDSEQKKAVRKECIRLMGTLATFHHNLIGPHIGKMVGSIVKRLKDPDSVVRDVCVETMGVLASRLSSFESDIEESFVVLVRPLFEAICEQNKHVQCGSALCLARVIDNAMDPPVSILQNMLTKTTKMLNNPHFMVKPAIIELNRSIIQAGGASTKNSLTVAMTSIQEALKNSDWSTRKAASSALAEFATSNGSYFGSFKSSSIRSLELCRFDKVKPVRDTVLQALQLWRGLKGTNAFECPEARSSIKGDYSESIMKDTRVPLSVKKNGHNYMESPQNLKQNDWNIEVSVPKSHNISLAYGHDEESEGSSVTKTFTSTQDIGYEYVPMDDKLEFSSTSNIQNVKFEAKLMGVNQFLADKEVSIEEQRYSAKIEDHKSLESSVMESSPEIMHGCCIQTRKDITFFREKLLDIDNKQSTLLDLLQVFTTKTVESLSMIQSKVSSLEHVVDQMAQNIGNGGTHLESTTKFLKKSSTTASPRLSTSTPRQSMEIRSRQSPLQPARQSDGSEDCIFGRGKSGNSTNQGIGSWMDPISRNHQKGISRLGNHSSINRKNALEVKKVNGCFLEQELDAAYVDALNSGDEMVLVYLFDKTGPVLEKLSHMTANVIVSTLALFLSEQRFLNSIIPWLQQVVELNSVHGSNHLLLTAKTRREFLYAIQEAMNMEFPNATTRRSITQLVTKLHQVWGKCS